MFFSFQQHPHKASARLLLGKCLGLQQVCVCNIDWGGGVATFIFVPQKTANQETYPKWAVIKNKRVV